MFQKLCTIYNTEVMVGTHRKIQQNGYNNTTTRLVSLHEEFAILQHRTHVIIIRRVGFDALMARI